MGSGYTKLESAALAALSAVGHSQHARRLQPYIEWREASLARLLGAAPLSCPGRERFRQGRVVLAISSLSSGGAERQVVNVARGLRRRGIDDTHILVEHLTDSPGNDFYLDAAKEAAASVSEAMTAPVEAAELAKLYSSLFLVTYRKLGRHVLGVAEFLRDRKPEIVHASLDWTNAAVGMAAALAGVPRIFLSGRNLAPWHFEFFSWFLYPSYRALLALPNVRLINNSEAGARDYEKWLQLSPGQVRVLRNGFDRSAFPPVSAQTRQAARRALSLPSEAHVIAGAFRFSTEKRPQLWIESAARVLRYDESAYFVLCGDGPLRANMEALAAHYGLSDRIRFPGIVADLHSIYAAADVVLLTSLKEGTPNVLLEAQAVGSPVVTTRAFGAAEAVEDGVTGLVVTTDTAEAIARAVLDVLSDADFRARTAVQGPLFIERKFGLERMIDDTLRLYAEAGASWAERYRSPKRCDQATSEQEGACKADIASSRPASHWDPSAPPFVRTRSQEP
jgi:glycosyltransferase involved in cell wall biosynthesis